MLRQLGIRLCLVVTPALCSCYCSQILSDRMREIIRHLTSPKMLMNEYLASIYSWPQPVRQFKAAFWQHLGLWIRTPRPQQMIKYIYRAFYDFFAWNTTRNVARNIAWRFTWTKVVWNIAWDILRNFAWTVARILHELLHKILQGRARALIQE